MVQESRPCPQNSPQIRVFGGDPTENPRTKRHCLAQGGTAANMVLLALPSLYAGSAGPDAADSPKWPGDYRPSVSRQVIGSSPIAGAQSVSPLTCINAGREGCPIAQSAPRGPKTHNQPRSRPPAPPRRGPADRRWSRKHANTSQRRLCERFAVPAIG